LGPRRGAHGAWFGHGALYLFCPSARIGRFLIRVRKKALAENAGRREVAGRVELRIAARHSERTWDCSHARRTGCKRDGHSEASAARRSRAQASPSPAQFVPIREQKHAGETSGEGWGLGKEAAENRSPLLSRDSGRWWRTRLAVAALLRVRLALCGSCLGRCGLASSSARSRRFFSSVVVLNLTQDLQGRGCTCRQPALGATTILPMRTAASCRMGITRSSGAEGLELQIVLHRRRTQSVVIDDPPKVDRPSGAPCLRRKAATGKSSSAPRA
jgi:hypothetical protein